MVEDNEVNSRRDVLAFINRCSTVYQFRDSTSLDGRQKSVIVFI
jgi:hypothetical protein